MTKSAMHKHIGNELVGLKFLSRKVVKAQFINQVNSPRTVKSDGRQKKNHINNQQIFDYGG